jgi:drug/metabolite transporter (DMT)-like permease
MTNKSMGMKEWFLLALLSLLWGGSFTFNEVILRELQPFTMVFSRSIIAAGILWVIVYVTGKKMPKTPEVWGSFMVMGILNNLVPFSLIVWGQSHIDSGLASILNATTPLFSVVLAHFLTKEEKITINRLAGVLMGLIGVAILVGPEALRGMQAQGLAQIAILAASCSYALAGIFGHRFQRMDPIIPATGMLTCTGILVLPLVLFIDKPQSLGFATLTWGSLLGQAILSTAIAYLIYFRILKTAGATNALLVTLLIPISALLLGLLVLGEAVGWALFAGMGLIFLGLILVDGRLMRSTRRSGG